MSSGAVFLVHYDLLQKPDVEYPTLIPTLTRLGARRLTSTAWAVRAEMSVVQLRDEIQFCALQGDRFVIAELREWRTMSTLNRIDDLEIDQSSGRPRSAPTKQG